MRATVQVCTRASARHVANQDRATVGSRVLTSTDEVEHVALHAPASVAVLDGVGGAPAPAQASDLAARAISVADAPCDGATARTLLQQADRRLLDAGRLDFTTAGMATTAALLVLHENGHASVVNVGDSSVAILDGEGLSAVSVSDRIGPTNIFQTLGGFDDPDMSPHVASLRLAPGDRLLLASDGLTDVLGPRTIADVLRQGSDPVGRLLARVEDAGLPDDVTILVVDIEAGGAGADGAELD